MIDAKRLSELFKLFREKKIWGEWHPAYLREVEYFKGLSDEAFVVPENQERLWRAREVSTIGPGESINVKGAYTDVEIATLFLKVRHLDLSGEVSVRARTVTELYNKIMAIILQKHSTMRPNAKLRRAFAVLLPKEIHTCFTHKSQVQLHKLLFGNRDYSFCEGAVYARDQIRKAVGGDVSIEDSVWHSMFCWWLHENYNQILSDNSSSLEEFFSISPQEEQEDTTLLEIWPPTKQRKGLTAVSKYLEAYRMVVTAARGGATPDDIVMTIRTYPDLANYAPSSCRQLFNLVRTFGFIENRDGLWHPSTEGEELVEDDPADILVEKLLIQVFGFGHLLLFVHNHTKVSRRQIFDYLRSVYNAWTSDFMPSALLAWLKSLGLIEFDAVSNVTLTEYGLNWVKRLPVELPAPEAVVDIDKYEHETKEAQKYAGLTIDQVKDGFVKDAEMRSFVFLPEQIESLHFAWHCNPKKRFVILSGLSGTGKTALLVQYSKLYCRLLDLSSDRHVAVIPVSPDWRDPSGIFGYFNALHADPTFQAEPGLRLILDAVQNPELPFFLILDEMNLARVERYFAPFLSSMETGHPLLLHAHDEAVNDVPPSVSWPKNLFIGGTVNMDETTHAFSDKVLDRAFTMEFWQVDLPEFFNRRQATGQFSSEPLEELMIRVNEQLFKIRRHFGYRTAGEVLDFIGAAGEITSDETFWRLADQAFFSKILPRIRGEQTHVMNQTFGDLHELFATHSMVRCKAKLLTMKESLNVSGVARFWA